MYDMVKIFGARHCFSCVVSWPYLWHENEKNTFTAISGDTFSKCANFS